MYLQFAFDLQLQVRYVCCMDITIQESKMLLRKSGLKSTMTRIAVLQQIWKEERPVSHSDLVHTLKHVGDQATIYRNLISFVEKGLARVASTASGIVRYELVREGEGSHEVHPHFVCQDCGMVTCLPKSTITTTVDPLWRERLHKSQMQFVGVCQACD
jgi:Fur family transcriptional regulator, ferric uptake regulator